jgi:3-oxoacyl-[acyl-carrier protein] reductase
MVEETQEDGGVMRRELSGRTALVTGGNVGIGRAIAIALAESGADVAVTYMTHAESDVVSSIEALGRTSMSLQVDVTDSGQVARAVEAIASAFGHIDILVNNAGGLVGRVPLGEMSDDHWRHVIDLNLSSAMYCARAVAPWMTPGPGRIINISSLAGRNGGSRGMVAYATAKAGMIGLTRALAKELAPGITVNAIAPGLILQTPFHETFTPEPDQLAMIEGTLVKRAGLPEDVAGAVVFFASDLASFVTGEVIDVNGGAYFT